MRRSTIEPRDAARDRAAAARLRQRLWGAAVLIALAVVGLPLLLDGSGSESRFRRVERLREEPPRIIATQDVDPVRAGAAAHATSSPSTASETAVDGVGENILGDVERGDGGNVERDDAGAPERYTGRGPTRDRDLPARGSGDTVQPLHAWVIQAGSFREQRNAIAVRDRLRRAGFPSFVTDTSVRRDAANRAPLPDRPGPLFRVQVGPIVDRTRAEETREAVIGLLGREAIVVAYP